MECRIIACYIGELPKWIPLWIESCKNNPKFNFLLITDQNIDMELPENLDIYKTTFFKIKEKIQKKFNFKISLEKPYKLCDYRPAYGVIFEEELKNYDYWGHCDLDMVFGDLDKILLPLMIKGYEKIGSYGHLTIYKNSEKIRESFRLEGAPFNYKKVYSLPQAFYFDEMKGINFIANKNNIKWCQISHDQIGDKMVLDNNFSNEVILAYRKNFKNQKIIYYNKKIFQCYKKENDIEMLELLYYHFSKTNLDLVNIKNLSKIVFLKNKIEELDYSKMRIEMNNQRHERIKIDYKKLKSQKIKRFLNKKNMDKIIYFKYIFFKMMWGRKIEI